MQILRGEPSDFIQMAKDDDVPLIRNDLLFDPIIKRNEIDLYVLHDHWHPNREGYRLIADNVFRFIGSSRILGETNHSATP